jgi:flagellar motor switch protein FliN/FliY
MNKMGDMLSQAEIDALLNGNSNTSAADSFGDGDVLSSQEIDALGEIGNISMGTSATTLFTLLGQKVLITTPTVSVTTLEQMAGDYTLPYVAVKVEYTAGLTGMNLLILKEDDVKIIADLMMGGDGTNTSGELSDLHLSAISEAMNQMIGSSSTSMSSMFDKRIDISPPKAFTIKFDSDNPLAEFGASDKIVKIAFKMVIGNLIDSEIMQLLPIDFAKNLVDNLLNVEIQGANNNPEPAKQPQQPQSQPQSQSQQPQYPSQQYAVPGQQQMGYSMNMEQNNHREFPRNTNPINVQPAQFQSFDDSRLVLEKKNIGMIMDVPLQVTVELGRTHKLIRDILSLAPARL